MKRILFFVVAIAILTAVASCKTTHQTRHMIRPGYSLIYQSGWKFFEINPQNARRCEISLSPSTQKTILHQEELYMLKKRIDNGVLSGFITPVNTEKQKMFFIYYSRYDKIIHVIDGTEVNKEITMNPFGLHSFFSKEELSQEIFNSILKHPGRIFWVSRKKE